MEGQTDRLEGRLTDRLKNRHTDEQLIDQTYIHTDRDMLEGLTRELTDKKMERTDRWTKRLTSSSTNAWTDRMMSIQATRGGWVVG